MPARGGGGHARREEIRLVARGDLFARTSLDLDQNWQGKLVHHRRHPKAQCIAQGGSGAVDMAVDQAGNQRMPASIQSRELCGQVERAAQAPNSSIFNPNIPTVPKCLAIEDRRTGDRKRFLNHLAIGLQRLVAFPQVLPTHLRRWRQTRRTRNEDSPHRARTDRMSPPACPAIADRFHRDLLREKRPGRRNPSAAMARKTIVSAAITTLCNRVD